MRPRGSRARCARASLLTLPSPGRLPRRPPLPAPATSTSAATTRSLRRSWRRQGCSVYRWFSTLISDGILIAHGACSSNGGRRLGRGGCREFPSPRVDQIAQLSLGASGRFYPSGWAVIEFVKNGQGQAGINCNLPSHNPGNLPRALLAEFTGVVTHRSDVTNCDRFHSVSAQIADDQGRNASLMQLHRGQADQADNGWKAKIEKSRSRVDNRNLLKARRAA